MARRFTPLHGILLALLICQSGVAEETQLPAPYPALLDSALKRDDGAHFVPAVLIAMEAAPDLADALYRHARALAPDYASALDAAVAAQFQNVAVITSGPAASPVVAQSEVLAGKVVSPASGFFDLAAWEGDAELGLALNSGDSDQRSLFLGIELARDMGALSHAFGASLDIARRGGQTSKERYLGEYQVSWNKWERAFLFGYVQIDVDRLSGFDYRLIENIGFGYALLDRPRHKWSVEGGPGVRQTKLAANGTEVEVLGRLSSDYSWQISEAASFENVTNALTGTERFTLDSTAELSTAINASLSAKLSFNYRYDSNVPAGAANTNTTTKATLVYDF
ncbi:MAG: DUF481 domain-containing protein [Sphingomonadales bacterium]|nr:DUF481 domain-containing protein [Sphingomonadales bacterium]